MVTGAAIPTNKSISFIHRGKQKQKDAGCKEGVNKTVAFAGPPTLIEFLVR